MNVSRISLQPEDFLYAVIDKIAGRNLGNEATGDIRSLRDQRQALDSFGPVTPVCQNVTDVSQAPALHRSKANSQDKLLHFGLTWSQVSSENQLIRPRRVRI